MHPGQQQEALETVMDQVGWVDTIIVNKRSGYVIDGHLRVSLALRRGEKSIPVQYVDLTEEEEQLILATLDPIAAMAATDTEKLSELMAGIDSDDEGVMSMLEQIAKAEKVAFGQPPPVEEPVDDAEILNKKWGVKLGDLWVAGEHRIVCGDCTDKIIVERVMDGEKADAVFTSPPYAVGVDYGETYQDTIDNLRAMLPKLSRLWMEIVRPGGFAVVNFGDIVSASHIVGTPDPCEYPMALEYWPVFRGDGWALWSRRIWCKPGAGTRSMQCISSNRAATNWEHVWTWRKDGPAMFSSQTIGDYPSQTGWFDSTHSEALEYGLKVHGAGMPPLPALFSVSNHSLPGGTVVDPFCGTGTTSVACERLGRKCMAIEISPAYVAVTLERLSNLGLTPERQNGNIGHAKSKKLKRQG